MSRGTLKVLIGLPASGKSTWCAEHTDRTFRLNSDDLIAMSGPYSKERQKIIRLGEDMMARDALLRGFDVLIDRTNLTAGERKRWLRLAGDVDCKTEAVCFGVDIKTAQSRNEERHDDTQVPFDIFDSMIERLEWPVDEEGFASVIDVLEVAEDETKH